MNFDKPLADFHPTHMLNRGDPLTMRYRRIEDALWARERNVPPYSDDLNDVPTDTLRTLFMRTTIDMSYTALTMGTLQCSCCGVTSIGIFKAYQEALSLPPIN